MGTLQVSISRLIDTSGLHKFKINCYNIHFLVPRSSEGSKKKAPSMEDSRCDSCRWTLPGGVAQGSEFCSIYCVVRKQKRSTWHTTLLSLRSVAGPSSRTCRRRGAQLTWRSIGSAHKNTINVEEKKGEQQQEDSSKIVGVAVVDASSRVCIRVHRRKGVPHRSPLF